MQIITKYYTALLRGESAAEVISGGVLMKTYGKGRVYKFGVLLEGGVFLIGACEDWKEYEYRRA